MHGAYHEQIWFYASAFGLAFMASLARAARDADCQSFICAVGAASSSGFFSLGIIATWHGYAGGGAHSPWYFLGIATLIGMLGSTQQDRYVKSVLSRVFKVFTEPQKDDKDKDVEEK